MIIWAQSPQVSYKAIQITNYEQIFLSKSPSFLTIKNCIGNEKAHSIIIIMLLDIIKFFNVGKSMDATQTDQTASLIESTYPHYKIEDFKFCFDNAKKGKYGKVYDRIDGHIILSWLEKYNEELYVVLEEFKRKENHNLKEQWKLEGTSDNLLKALTIVTDKIEAKKRGIVNDKIVKQSQSISNSAEMDIYNSFLKDFHKLFNQNGFVKSGIYFIEFEGKFTDRDAYIKRRYEEHNKFVSFLTNKFYELYEESGTNKGSTMYVTFDNEEVNLEEYIDINLNFNL